MTKPDLKHPATWIATWFGLGLIPKAPGTWGSIGAIPFIALCIYFGGVIALCAFTLLSTMIGFWAADHFEKQTATHDNKRIVIDEVAGQALTFLPLFALAPAPSIIHYALGFVLFRAFDILKPWPVSYCDKHIGGAAGVMIDDLAAGILAGICLAGVAYAGLG
ncbi:MAG: phosphatidylglycerophosphatase A [Bdellovibrionales bacterium]